MWQGSQHNSCPRTRRGTRWRRTGPRCGCRTSPRPRASRSRPPRAACRARRASARRSPSGCAGWRRDMGYVANVHARSLAGGASRSVGLLVHEIGDPYFAEIASGVLRVGARRGLTVQICHTGRDPQQELEQIRTLIANRVGAIIIAGSGFVDPAPPGRGQGRPGELPPASAAGSRVIGRHHLERRRRAARQPGRGPGRRPAPARPRPPPDRRRRRPRGR